jgi:PPOX class probable F420-dependent enzyme
MSQSREQIDDVLRQPRIGLLGTLNKDGSPNSMPLWYEWDGEKIRMFTFANAGKLRRLKNDPRACLTVADGVDVPGNWVSVEGNVEILSAGGRELACRLAVDYYEPEQAKNAIEVWSDADLILLELNPTRIRAWSRVSGFYSERL